MCCENVFKVDPVAKSYDINVPPESPATIVLPSLDRATELI
jgi:hypothetical protein